MAFQITTENIAVCIVDMLRRELPRFEARIEKFKKRFDEDAAYALDWSEDVFHAVAIRDIYTSAIKRLGALTVSDDQMAGVTALRTYAESMAFSQARTSNSTSQTANLLARSRGGAWVELIEVLDSFIKAAKTVEPFQQPIGPQS